MKHLLSLLLFASPVLAEPVCTRWERRCTDNVESYSFKYGYCGAWVDVCAAWHETPTPVATAKVAGSYAVDSPGQLVISKKSDAEALKALGLKMCEGR